RRQPRHPPRRPRQAARRPPPPAPPPPCVPPPYRPSSHASCLHPSVRLIWFDCMQPAACSCPLAFWGGIRYTLNEPAHPAARKGEIPGPACPRGAGARRPGGPPLLGKDTPCVFVFIPLAAR